MSLGHEEDGNMKTGTGQGFWEPLGHASGGNVEKGRQDVAEYWSLHSGCSWWPRVPDFCEALALVAPQQQRGGNPAYPTQPGSSSRSLRKGGNQVLMDQLLLRCFPEILTKGKNRVPELPLQKRLW